MVIDTISTCTKFKFLFKSNLSNQSKNANFSVVTSHWEVRHFSSKHSFNVASKKGYIQNMDINVPVTLVIRAPNQRVEDHTVECMLGWTVKKLKRHLEVVYPSNPKETQQRLIYSGKLLADEMTLKEIIIQNEDKIHHTVHLVCSPSVESSYNESPKPHEKTSSSTISSSYTSRTTHSSEGLRQRIHHSQGSQPTSIASTSNTTSPIQSPPVMMPNSPGMAVTPEQYMMMMQNYYYQMTTQYMQYYQTGTYQPMTPQVVTEQENETPQQNNQEAPAARPDNVNQVMNAQGGLEDEDDDAEFFGPRDWLDYVYTFSRFMVLISIVYFYSNFTRFLAVAAFFFLVYLYQTGWFAVRRRNREQENENDAEQEQPQQTENIPRDPGAEENPVEEGSDTSQTESTTAEPAEPPAPGALRVAWSFVSTFFSSLIPEPPAPINAN